MSKTESSSDRCSKEYQGKDMFNGETAWFSSSVKNEEIKAWNQHDGVTKTQDKAMYLFSRDSSCTDTIKIYESEAYIDEHVSVIHPQYITDCIQTGERENVVLMDYNFPPQDVLKASKGKIVYKWQIRENTESFKKKIIEESPRKARDNQPSIKHKQGISYLDLNDLPKIAGTLQCLIPGQNGFQVHEVTSKT